MNDPFSTAIAQAVDAAIEARLPLIVESLKSAITPTTRQLDTRQDRFVAMPRLIDIFGADRTTIRRRAARGVYPPLRKHGMNIGYYQSDLDKIFAK